MNDIRIMMAPIQYATLTVCELRTICPTSEIGIVKLNPTVTTNGDVKSIAYAQVISDTREMTPFT